MNNEVLEKIEEYNKGGLFNEPLSFTTKLDPSATATFLNSFSMPTSHGFKSFTIPPEKTVELTAEHVVNSALVRDNPENMENYIRAELAQKLAKQLIEEDLIQIQSCEDIEHMNTTFCAKIKVVQE